MYYPIQTPFILNQAFSQNMNYTETSATECNGFVICFWEMKPISNRKMSIKNVIVTDACIDIIAGYDDRRIGFAGTSKTDFYYTVELPSRFIGARLIPGAFNQLTGLPAAAAMDTFLPISTVFESFDQSLFFSLPFEKSKEYFKEFISGITQHKTPNMFTALFNTLSENAPFNTKELYQRLNFSPRQCQRLFAKHYGITPKMALSIVRFQKCMEILTSPQARPADILNITGYYDQPHFIKDFKRNIGITPLELIRIYQS